MLAYHASRDYEEVKAWREKISNGLKKRYEQSPERMREIARKAALAAAAKIKDPSLPTYLGKYKEKGTFLGYIVQKHPMQGKHKKRFYNPNDPESTRPQADEYLALLNKLIKPLDTKSTPTLKQLKEIVDNQGSETKYAVGLDVRA